MVDDIDSGTDAKQRREILKRKENLMQEYRRKQRAEYWREEVINTCLLYTSDPAHRAARFHPARRRHGDGLASGLSHFDRGKPIARPVHRLVRQAAFQVAQIDKTAFRRHQLV